MTNIFIKKTDGTRVTAGFLGVALCLMLAQQAFAANVLKEVKTSSQADGKTAVTLQFAEPIGERYDRVVSTGFDPSPASMRTAWCFLRRPKSRR